jgi:hypothetical protein
MWPQDPKIGRTHKMKMDIGKTIDSPEMIHAAVTGDVAIPPDETTTDHDDEMVKGTATTVVMMATALQITMMIVMRGDDEKDKKERKPGRGPPNPPINDDDGDDGSDGGHSSEENRRRNRNPQDDAPEDSDASCSPATRLKYEFYKIPTTANSHICSATWRYPICCCSDWCSLQDAETKEFLGSAKLPPCAVQMNFGVPEKRRSLKFELTVAAMTAGEDIPAIYNVLRREGEKVHNKMRGLNGRRCVWCVCEHFASPNVDSKCATQLLISRASSCQKETKAW